MFTGLRERREHDPAECESGQPAGLPEVGRAVRGHVGRGGVIILTLYDLQVIRVYICIHSSILYACMGTPRLEHEYYVNTIVY